METGSLLAELKRRRVFRVLLGYGVVVFAVLQIVEPIVHGLQWPDAVVSYVVVALAAGIPVAVALAWVYELNAGRLERTRAAPASAARAARLAFALILVAVLVAVAAVWTGVRRPEAAPKRIAILPFASLNAGDDVAYFADGVHSELLTQLAKVSGVEVISRTSVLQYRTGSARNLPEIAATLGVSSILEGSVQRSGDRVRIEARLVDARRDRQLWAERYDRQLTDMFAIQTAVAEEIARALGARLSPEEKARLDQRPTDNAEAYDFYLRAVEYWPNRPGYLPADLGIAEQLYERAIQRDPSFALAHALLSRLQTQGFYWMLGESPSRLQKGKIEAERALELQPDLAEAHAAIGYYAYYGLRNYDRALAEFALALKEKPNDPSLAMAIGFVQRRKGEFEPALSTLTHAVRLDPRSSYDLFETGWTLMMLRRYDEARRYLDRSLALAPDFFTARLGSAFIALLADGNADPAREMLRRLPAHIDHPQVVEFLELDPRLSLDIVASRHGEAVTTRNVVIPMSLLAGWAYRALGDGARARENFEAARRTLEAGVALQPDNPSFRAPLARAYAALGRKEDAIREARKAVELLPLARDAFDGSYYLQELSVVYAETGETDAAMREVEHLLAIPSLASVPRLRIDGKWVPLRTLPRFQTLVARR